ncbi:MAG: VOC family protein [Pseudohongiellaceae bacterium]|jgi:predicted enzyme related to lactoylglutathione lyase|nr:VOC family protein [Pseudomonadales bacterium]|tara:strand:- start:1 stop:405 length:405 start_codon:yes stop_codon:yes gene_type:complete
MGLETQKSSIDIGIIVKDIDAMMKFYGEILGLDLEATIPMPGGGTMNRFKVGDSIIKLIALDPAPSAEAEPGGIRAASGYRYWTIHVPSLEEIIGKVEAGGGKVVVPIREIREGVSIAFLEDPDGNWVELLQNS